MNNTSATTKASSSMPKATTNPASKSAARSTSKSLKSTSQSKSRSTSKSKVSQSKTKTTTSTSATDSAHSQRKLGADKTVRFLSLMYVHRILTPIKTTALVELDDEALYKSEDESSDEIADPPEMSFVFDVWDTHKGSMSVRQKARLELHPVCVRIVHYVSSSPHRALTQIHPGT